MAFGARPVERGEQRVHAGRGVELAERRQPRERFGDAGEPGAGEQPMARPNELGRPLPAVLVALQVGPRQGDSLDARHQRLGDRADVGAVRPLGGQQLERSHEPGLVEHLARLERPALGGVDARAVRLHREDRGEHGEASGVGGGHGHAGAGEIERRLYEPRPRQPAEARVQGAEPAWEARDRAGPGPDRVMDELLAEGDAQLDRRRARSRRHVDEAVEAPRLAPVPVDRVPTSQQAGHHRLGDARGQAGCNGRIGSRSTLFEDLDPRRHGRGVSGCDGAWEHGLLP